MCHFYGLNVCVHMSHFNPYCGGMRGWRPLAGAGVTRVEPSGKGLVPLGKRPWELARPFQHTRTQCKDNYKSGRGPFHDKKFSMTNNAGSTLMFKSPKLVLYACAIEAQTYNCYTRGVQTFGVSGPHWKKKSCLGSHVKHTNTNENWWAKTKTKTKPKMFGA